MNVQSVKSNNAYPAPGRVDDNNKKVKTAALAGSLLGVGLSAASVLYASSKKIPDFKLSKFQYKDSQLLLFGFASVWGGLIGGIAKDKSENTKYKYREAMHQFLGNIIAPISVLAVTTRIFDKTKLFSNAKPLVKNIAKGVVTFSSLIFGMEAGNRVVGKINNKLFQEEVKHKVKLEDYSVHADDICMAVSHIDKTSKISTIASHLLPFSFIISGYKTGSAQKKTLKN